MPDPAQRGVSNFIANIYEFNSVINSVLQGRFGGAAQSSGRFVVNTTLGLLGFFDVATPLGIEPNRADFGQTLAVWGFDQGPFVMLPLFGPRTVRSGVGYFFDTYTSIPYLIRQMLLEQLPGRKKRPSGIAISSFAMPTCRRGKPSSTAVW